MVRFKIQSEQVESPAGLDVEVDEGVGLCGRAGIYETGISPCGCSDKPPVVIPYHGQSAAIVHSERTPFLRTVQIAVIETRNNLGKDSDGEIPAWNPVEAVASAETDVVSVRRIDPILPLLGQPCLDLVGQLGKVKLHLLTLICGSEHERALTAPLDLAKRKRGRV